MSSDSKNPFASLAAKDQSAKSPFQPASSRPEKKPIISPFKIAKAPEKTPAKTTPKPLPEKEVLPFALDQKIDPDSAFEPSEGFTPEVKVPPPPLEQKFPFKPEAPAAKKPEPKVEKISEKPALKPASKTPPALPTANEDFAMTEESKKAAPEEKTVVPEKEAPAKAAPKKEKTLESVSGDTSQLVLRAIFGVAEDLDRTEILQRARTLPGIRNLQLVGHAETSAIATLRKSIQRMGFGNQASLTFSASGGAIELIEEPGTTLAVLREGDYSPGVRETLIIVARELSRLG